MSSKHTVNYDFTKYDDKHSAENNNNTHNHETVVKGSGEDSKGFGAYLYCTRCGLSADKNHIQRIPCHDKGANRSYDNKYRDAEIR